MLTIAFQTSSHATIVYLSTSKKKAPGFQNQMLEDDVWDEERNPDYTFIIPAKVALDEGSVKRWWASMKSTEKWSIFNNCCDAVKRAIEAG